MRFVRIGQFHAKADSAETLSQLYEREAIPVIRAAKGNVSAVLLRQHQDADLFLAITIWKDEEAARAYEQSGTAQAMVGKIRHLFAAPPALTTYDAYGIAAAAS